MDKDKDPYKRNEAKAADMERIYARYLKLKAGEGEITAAVIAKRLGITYSRLMDILRRYRSAGHSSGC